MNLKGDFNPETTYSIGDVVRFNEMAFVLKEEAPAGTLPIDTLRWIAAQLWDSGFFIFFFFTFVV